MSTPHKHKDLIIAWANGAKIQYRTAGDGWESASTPTWRESYEYRIKPQPKKCRVALVKGTITQSYFLHTVRENDFPGFQSRDYFVKWISPVIEYTED